MTLLRCPHAPTCRTWVNFPTPAEADRALAAHLTDRHHTKETTMTQLSEPKSPLTSARVFDTTTSEALAYWLDNDAKAMDGQPGRNNHVAATRAAIERLLAEWDTLCFIDQTVYANEDSSERVTWTNAEVLEMLASIRATLVGGAERG